MTPEPQPQASAQGGSLPRNVRPLPCPFCGRKPVVERQGELWAVYCKATRCQVNPKTYPIDLKAGPVATKEHAVMCWNRRPNAQAVPNGERNAPQKR